VGGDSGSLQLKLNIKLEHIAQTKARLDTGNAVFVFAMASWMRLRREKNIDPEFQKIKTQLANVATALEACLRGLETVSADYQRLYKGVASFANDFYSLYPSEDDVRRLGKRQWPRLTHCC
jgi:hypothetical protein